MNQHQDSLENIYRYYFKINQKLIKSSKLKVEIYYNNDIINTLIFNIKNKSLYVLQLGKTKFITI